MLRKSGQGSNCMIQRFKLILTVTRCHYNELNSLFLPADLQWDFDFAVLVMIDAHYFFFKKQTVQKQEGKSKIS